MKYADIVRIEIPGRERLFQLRWKVTSLCNYRCDFCIQGDPPAHRAQAQGESGALRQAICRNVVRFIGEELDGRYESLSLHLVGGEVTIIPEFPDLFAALVSARFGGRIQFTVTTNFSRDGSYFERLFQPLAEAARGGADRTLRLNLSFYKAYTAADAFWEKTAALVQAARRADGRSARLPAFGARFGRPVPWLSPNVVFPVADDDDVAECMRMTRRARALGITVRPQILRNYPLHLSPGAEARLLKPSRRNTVFVTTRDGAVTSLRSISELGLLLADTDRFDPRAFVCDAGVHSLNVRSDGQACRCPPDFDTGMGNMAEGTVRLLPESRLCPHDHCSCNSFRLIERRSSPAP